MIRRPPRSTRVRSSAASDVYKRQTVLREEVRLTVAGRTDAGVHALGQVASFVPEAEVGEVLARRLNGVGPADLAVTAASAVADGFDARHDAGSRSYLY